MVIKYFCLFPQLEMQSYRSSNRKTFGFYSSFFEKGEGWQTNLFAHVKNQTASIIREQILASSWIQTIF